MTSEFVSKEKQIRSVSELDYQPRMETNNEKQKDFWQAARPHQPS
jgi:hypothetical protein